MPEVNLIATIDATPETLGAAAALLLDYGQLVRSEPGNVRFEIYRDRDGERIVVIERYVSDEAFQAHLSTEANAEVNAKLGEVLDGGGGVLQMLEQF